jgi:large subunit ribosomal protein L25
VGTIEALPRSAVGSRDAQWARQNALIPGIIYGFDSDGREDVVLVYVREADLRREVNKRAEFFSNTLFDISFNGKKHRVLPRDFQIHPFRPKAISINWLRYTVGAYPGAKIEIPLKGFNEERCPAYKDGGWYLALQHKLAVYANGETIPDYLMMDFRNKKVGEKFMASEIELNEGLILRSVQRDFAVGRFLGGRKGATSDDDKKAAPASASGDASKSTPAPAAAAAKK